MKRVHQRPSTATQVSKWTSPSQPRFSALTQRYSPDGASFYWSGGQLEVRGPDPVPARRIPKIRSASVLRFELLAGRGDIFQEGAATFGIKAANVKCVSTAKNDRHGIAFCA